MQEEMELVGADPANPVTGGNLFTYTSCSIADEEKAAKIKFVLLYGSCANRSINPNRPPNDIDILYRGLTHDEACAIARAQTMEHMGLPIQAILHQELPNGDDLPVRINVPCDSPATAWQFLYTENCGNVKPFIYREYTILTSILREGAGIEKALERIQKRHYFEFNIRENGNYAADQHDAYSKGRLAFVDAVEKHFGRSQFNQLCEMLWCGPLLRRLSEEPPTNPGSVDEVAMQSLSGATTAEYHACLSFNNRTEQIHARRDAMRWIDPAYTCVAWLERLYGPPGPIAYTWEEARVQRGVQALTVQ